MSMAGTATAARLLVKSSSQISSGAVNSGDIRDGSVSNQDVRDNTITGAKLRNGTVGIGDLEASARPAGSPGAEAVEAFRRSGPLGQEPGKPVRVATLNDIGAGTYVILAKTILTPTENRGGLFKEGEAVGGHCSLDAEGERDEARALISTPGAKSPGMLNLQLTKSYSKAGSAALDCDVTNAKWNATDTSIIAIRVGRAPRHPVEG